jgi:hypothetical protein
MCEEKIQKALGVETWKDAQALFDAKIICCENKFIQSSRLPIPNLNPTDPVESQRLIPCSLFLNCWLK